MEMATSKYSDQPHDGDQKNHKALSVHSVQYAERTSSRAARATQDVTMAKDINRNPNPPSRGAAGSANDDGRVYEYTGPASVLHNGSIMLPKLDESPGRGEYRATIILWPNDRTQARGASEQQQTDRRNPASPGVTG